MSDERTNGDAPKTLFYKLLELLSDSFVYGLSTLLSQIIGFLMLPIYTRHLTPADYGVLAMMNLLTMAFLPLASLCMLSGAYRRLQAQPDEEMRRTVLSTGLAGVSLFACLSLLLGCFFAEWPALWLVGDKSSSPLVRITMFTVAMTILGDATRIDLRSRRRTRTVASLNIATFVVTLLITIRLVVYDELGVAGVVWGGAGGALFGMFAGFAATRGRFPLRFNRVELRRMLQYGLPIVPHRLVSVGLMTYSQYYVREMLGLDEAGLFDMAARFAMPLGLVINAVQEAWVPYKFHIHANDDRPQEFFRESFTYYLALILYLWVGAAAWGPEVLRLMTDVRFHAAASLVALTGLMRIMWGVYMMMGSGIELSDDTRPYSLISISGLIIVVSLTPLAVPAFGAAGAALSTTAGYLTMAVMARRLARTRFYIAYDWPRIAVLSAVASGCAAISYFFDGLSLVPRLTVAIVISLTFPAAAWVIVGGRRHDATTWRQPVQAEIGS